MVTAGARNDKNEIDDGDCKNLEAPCILVSRAIYLVRDDLG